jgi:hypothetical protein
VHNSAHNGEGSSWALPSPGHMEIPPEELKGKSKTEVTWTLLSKTETGEGSGPPEGND